ncbi:helix-turn-helix domain-containing protein [Paraburkholderia terricola]|uniref:helix-turn-helix domain-containing protein n=1 Tax=Paraburkholderia terricola TaxID=169427 RepID=UPI0028595378|nr:helix-turn-helix transcriptional regulator [Paraburkholderia terricola]MDR6480568.1 transcriptional regulator with XRE-family HTH domain [Paraburkholderia terricola]
MPIRSNQPTNYTQDTQLAARVGESIAELRRAKGLTQAQLAEMIDLEQEAVSRWERGTRVPTLLRLQQLSDALECSVDQLLQRGSKRPDDQLANVANALTGLDADERALVVNFVQQFTDMLRLRHSGKSPQRK